MMTASELEYSVQYSLQGQSNRQGGVPGLLDPAFLEPLAMKSLSSAM
jgi:hypothetical protein